MTIHECDRPIARDGVPGWGTAGSDDASGAGSNSAKWDLVEIKFAGNYRSAPPNFAMRWIGRLGAIQVRIAVQSLMLLTILLLGCTQSEPAPSGMVPEELVGDWLAADRTSWFRLNSDGTYAFDDGDMLELDPADSGTFSYDGEMIHLVSTQPDSICGEGATAVWEVLRLDELTLRARVIEDTCAMDSVGTQEGFVLNFIRCTPERDAEGHVTCVPG